jgi:hypothetical protein
MELIKKNAMRYNAESSPAHKNAVRLAHFFKTRILSKFFCYPYMFYRLITNTLYIEPSMPLANSRGGGGGGRKKVVAEESDDEYDNEEAQRYESEEEPILKKSSYRSEDEDDDEDDFVNDDDEDDYYE